MQIVDNLTPDDGYSTAARFQKAQIRDVVNPARDSSRMAVD
jgi:hypothetical protein